MSRPGRPAPGHECSCPRGRPRSSDLPRGTDRRAFGAHQKGPTCAREKGPTGCARNQKTLVPRRAHGQQRRRARARRTCRPGGGDRDTYAHAARGRSDAPSLLRGTDSSLRRCRRDPPPRGRHRGADVLLPRRSAREVGHDHGAHLDASQRRRGSTCVALGVTDPTAWSSTEALQWRTRVRAARLMDFGVSRPTGIGLARQAEAFPTNVTTEAGRTAAKIPSSTGDAPANEPACFQASHADWQSPCMNSGAHAERRGDIDQKSLWSEWHASSRAASRASAARVIAVR
jgi:hypothetical protein